ncbi:hypothetical protein NEOLI_005378, partial [Neolecta irregularis DAH-3]
MFLMSLNTGFDIKFIDGVDGDAVADKAIPGNTKEGLSPLPGVTALIMEDDINWSFRLKESLSAIAVNINHLESQRLGDQYVFDRKNPYTLTWDIIYLGSCLESVPKKDVAATFYDDTVPSRENTTEHYLAILNHFRAPQKHRIVIEAQAPVCTYGYSVTR